MTTATDQVRDLTRQWAEAEQRGDTQTLSSIATDDFRLVGPVGFVLDKQQWLDRYRSGDFKTNKLELKDVSIREYGNSAIVIGTQAQQASYQGNPANGEFRITEVCVRDGDGGAWRLAGIHLSPAGGPPPFARQGR